MKASEEAKEGKGKRSLESLIQTNLSSHFVATSCDLSNGTMRSIIRAYSKPPDQCLLGHCQFQIVWLYSLHTGFLLCDPSIRQFILNLVSDVRQMPLSLIRRFLSAPRSTAAAWLQDSSGAVSAKNAVPIEIWPDLLDFFRVSDRFLFRAVANFPRSTAENVNIFHCYYW